VRGLVARWRPERRQQDRDRGRNERSNERLALCEGQGSAYESGDSDSVQPTI
jgi:hypothetical protein